MLLKGKLLTSFYSCIIQITGKYIHANNSIETGLLTKGITIRANVHQELFILFKTHAMVNRRTLIGILASLPLALMANARSILMPRLTKDFKVRAGEACFGSRYRMKSER